MYERDLISVVIVNWNRKELVRACLESLRNQTCKNFEIIVVDNASCDGSVELIKSYFPEVKLIANKDNLLYSFAQNQGINLSRGEFILCLNNDVVLDRNFLKEAFIAMEKDESIGIVSGKVLSMDKAFIDTTGQFLSRCRKPLERGYKQEDFGQFDREGFVFGAGGVSPLYRKKMLEEIELKEGEYFDNTYGLFYEDLDLNWRANLFGWKAYYTPKAICYHIRGGSAKLNTPKIGLFKKFDFCYLLPQHQLLLLKNRYSTIVKNDTPLNFLANFPFILSYDLLIWIYLFFFRPSVIIKLLVDVRFLKMANDKRKIIRENMERI